MAINMNLKKLHEQAAIRKLNETASEPDFRKHVSTLMSEHQANIEALKSAIIDLNEDIQTLKKHINSLNVRNEALIKRVKNQKIENEPKLQRIPDVPPRTK